MEGKPLSSLQKDGKYYIYNGHKLEPNKPIKSTREEKKMMVLATKVIDGTKYVKLIHFGAKGYGHNYSTKAKKNYLTRSAGIRDKEGHLTKQVLNQLKRPNLLKRKFRL